MWFFFLYLINLQTEVLIFPTFVIFLSLFPQNEVNKDDLKEALEQEFIYRVNEVGVDLNRSIAHGHTQAMVQFVCGMGPRKGNAMIRVSGIVRSKTELYPQILIYIVKKDSCLVLYFISSSYLRTLPGKQIIVLTYYVVITEGHASWLFAPVHESTDMIYEYGDIWFDLTCIDLTKKT